MGKRLRVYEAADLTATFEPGRCPPGQSLPVLPELDDDHLDGV